MSPAKEKVMSLPTNQTIGLSFGGDPIIAIRSAGKTLIQLNALLEAISRASTDSLKVKHLADLGAGIALEVGDELGMCAVELLELEERGGDHGAQ